MSRPLNIKSRFIFHDEAMEFVWRKKIANFENHQGYCILKFSGKTGFSYVIDRQSQKVLLFRDVSFSRRGGTLLNIPFSQLSFNT